jgi:hypothetical protein
MQTKVRTLEDSTIARWYEMYKNFHNFITHDSCLKIKISQNFHRKINLRNFLLNNKNLNAENRREIKITGKRCDDGLIPIIWDKSW